MITSQGITNQKIGIHLPYNFHFFYNSNAFLGKSNLTESIFFAIKARTDNKKEVLLSSYKEFPFFEKKEKTLLSIDWTFIISFTLLVVLCTIAKFLFAKRKINLLYNFHKKNFEMESKIHQLMMDPHFIFNILGDIEYFVLKNDKREVNKYIGTISGLIRQTIDLCNLDQVSIRLEVQYLQSYLNLMNYRLGDTVKIKFDIDVNLNLDSEIACMLTQPIVENAVIHGLVPKKENRRLDISYRLLEGNYLLISVQDNGIGLKASQNKKKTYTSIATKSIQKRIANYNQLHQKKIFIEFKNLIKNKKNNGTLVQLSMPLPEN